MLMLIIVLLYIWIH